MNILDYQKDLEKRNIKPVNLVYGEEEYLYKTFVDKLSKLYRVEILWGDEINKEEFLRRVSEGDLFSFQKRVFVVKRAEELLKKIKDHKFIPNLAKRLRSSFVFFVVLEKLSKQDLEKEPIKSISQVGDLLELKKLDKKKTRELVQGKFDKEGVQIEEQALDFLLSATDYDLMKLKNEVDKLLLLGKKNITLEDVRRVCLWDAQANMFDFVDAFFTKDKEKALLQLSSLLRNGVPPLQIFAMLSNYAIKLYTLYGMLKDGSSVESALHRLDVKHPFLFRL